MLLDYTYEPSSQTLEVSYINKDRKREIENFEYEPYQWIKTSANSKNKDPLIRSWDGDHVVKKKTKTANKFTLRDFIYDLRKKRPDIFDLHLPKAWFCDIEVVAEDEFPEADEVKYPVVSIALVNESQDCYLLSVDSLSSTQVKQMEQDMNKHFQSLNLDNEFSLSFKNFKSEREMLAYFMYKLVPKMSILSGWNFEEFDWQYLFRRSKKLNLDIEKSAITNKFHFKKSSGYLLPVHTIIADYQKLYEKYDYSVKVKESSKLDWVSEEILGIKKLKYNGSLFQLYHSNIYKYLLYNIIDTALVKLIHDKIQCLTPHLLLSFLTTAKVYDAFSPVALTESAIQEDMMIDKNYVFAKSFEEEKKKGKGYEGGWVKDIKVGLYKLITIFDFSSLYPSLMRMFNISPDSYLGQFDTSRNQFYNFREKGWQNFDKTKHIKCVNNAIFSKKDSVMRKKLTEFYKLRKQFQAEMFVAEKNIELIKRHIKQKI